ncbi:pyruvate dehydrogenase complex E1 component subunit beta [Candidatus Cyanaurora vandensis]|uniref:pyruvate dehydrogenase complex E1 component subunit beta n=1 Tax=Candidatus Cyanaurora vandensis TaxID=2714958 RepID=UPI00257BFB07|nr:pyruvate dehydrogenase complex E1 component subunit beta [Candidatus Cyanaurora vandensis]
MVMQYYFEALRDAIYEEMVRDPMVMVMGEDVGHYGGSYKVTKDLFKEFGGLRVLDTPIAENSFAGMAVGCAMTGVRPIIEGMNMGFLLLAFSQIANNGGMLRYTSGGQFTVPMVVRGPGGVGRQLGAEHSQRLEAYFYGVPGLKIIAPATPLDAKGLLKSAIRDNNTVLFFEHVLLYNLKEEIPDGVDYIVPIGKANRLREGQDLTILTYSRQVHHCLSAVKTLVNEGYDPELIDLRTLKPLDLEMICESVHKTHRVLIVEEDYKTGGIGGEIIALLNEHCFDDLDAPPVRLASRDIPTPYNGRMEAATIPQVADILQAVKHLVD